MYYLKTRFYNSEWCRYINSDNINYLEYDNLLGVNLFSYCNNNPVMNVDPDGLFWKEAFDYINTFLGLINDPSAVIAVGAVASAIFKGNWQDVVDDFNNGCINPFN